MNATLPININPVNQAPPSATGKQQDAAADVPFSQVLSSEMAQNRNGGNTRENTDVAAVSADAAAAASAQSADTEATARDPLVESIPVTAETLLALALPPDLQKLALANDSGTLPETSPGLGKQAAHSLTMDSRKGRTDLPQAKPADESADSLKPDTPSTGKTRLQAATLAAAAASANTQSSSSAVFASQLAAARQTEVLKTGELPTGLMNHAALQPATQPLSDLQPASIDSLATNKLAPSVGTAAWSQALGEKIVWMAAGSQQTASLTLNPPNMGPLQIVLNITNDQATASFFSAQPEVRQALESAFPKLREMMNEAGIELGQATVSADTPRQNDSSDRQAQRAAPPFIVDDNGTAFGQTSPHAVIQQTGRGLVDTFA